MGAIKRGVEGKAVEYPAVVAGVGFQLGDVGV
jgi:hypothetical protein